MARTKIFIDGFNFYFGLLKHSPYKWLNIHSLFEYLVHEQDPTSQINGCHFYSAMVKGKLASRGEQTVISQQAYHRALGSIYTPPVKLILSNHQIESGPLPRYVKGVAPDKQDRVNVWRIEEKETDVRIALDAYRAAMGGTIDQLVVSSNDTDLVPLLEAVREDAPQIRIGLVIPKQKDSGRQAAKRLTDLAHWTRKYVRPEELEAHQFPTKVATAKKPIFKPEYW